MILGACMQHNINRLGTHVYKYLLLIINGYTEVSTAHTHAHTRVYILRAYKVKQL